MTYRSCACRWNCPIESAAKLIEFLYELADALERHYAGQLMRYTRERSATPSAADTPSHDLPF